MTHTNENKVTTNYDFEIPEGLEDLEAYDWVRPKIEASWNKAKDSIFETGNWLVAAKERTVHGEWKDFVKTLPFKKSTEEKLRKIAECETFSRPEVYKVLPNSWGTLDELRMRTESDEDAFLEKISEGKISSDMTRENAKFLYASGKASSPRTEFSKTPTGEVLTWLADTDAKYGCIYADPPWAASKGTPNKTGIQINDEYNSMSQTELLEMAPVVDQLSAEKSQLHLWCTTNTLQDALALMEAWGFEYRSQLVWTKPKGIPLGDYWANAHEILLLGVKGGNCPFKRDGEYPSSVFEAPSGEHSKKPDGIRDLVAEVSPEYRLELFARQSYEGWTCWGDEIDGFINVATQFEEAA
ncbi:MAG: hypothetical protein CMM54_07615 [Rhodospirillaceae bacterium]|nr:hypothetical protein [Rhodospirillaceae bacterium]|tara:strand:- start:12 stop:1076 length:1065 start_codon:yes stop_codon:yes gene_type:complete